MMRSSQDVPLAIDGRMCLGKGTGVATYAKALSMAHRRLSAYPFILADGSSEADGSGIKWQRRLRALWPGGIQARKDGSTFRAPDLFRLAQVYFDVHDRLLVVHPPISGGIMHWSYPLPLRIAGWRNIYTIHDAIPLNSPELTTIDCRRHERLLQCIAVSADALVTVSEAARKEIAAALAIPPNLIVNCSQAISFAATSNLPPAGLPTGQYLLAIGTVEPRKNIARLLDAHRRSGTALPLVIAGPSGAGADAFALEARITAAEKVDRLPYVRAADMPGLIAGARALIMPSLAEGFGLPVAEAMSLGTPVITSNRGALAETAGGAALLVTPEDVVALAAAIKLISEDNEEHSRLAEAGRDNARRFTMTSFVERLGVLYRSLLPLSYTADIHL